MNVYEIKLKDNVSVIPYIQILKQLGEFSLNQNIIYLHTNQKVNYIKNHIFNIQNIKQLHIDSCNDINSNLCKEFCINAISEDEIKQFEKDNQQPLESMNKKLDFLLDLKGKGKLQEYLQKVQSDYINKMKEGDANAKRTEAKEPDKSRAGKTKDTG